MSQTLSTMVELGTVAPAFELTDAVTGKAFSRDDIAALGTSGGLLVMFICVHCPYVKHVEAGAGPHRRRTTPARSASRPSPPTTSRSTPRTARST